MLNSRRAIDKGFLCTVAGYASLGWDWSEKRKIIPNAVSLGVFYGTVKVTTWAMVFAETHPTIDGLHMAAIIGAVLLPFTALQGAVIKFQFQSLQEGLGK